MKNFQKFLLILICISIIFTITSIIQTYAKYITSVSGTTATGIARWNIIVNNVSIKNNTDLSSAISPVFLGNSNIAENVLAPAAQGYFDLDLDYSQVDVSFMYNISVNSNENSAVADFIITGYSVDGGSTEEFSDEAGIVGYISYTDDILASNTSKSVRVFVEWNDNPDNTVMNNIDDTLATMDVLDSATNTLVSQKRSS